MAILPTGTLKSNINSELADNNAGQISAYDVRHNLIDIVDSINQTVASGDFDSSTPFTPNNVRAKISNNAGGFFVAESGILFPNATSTNQGKQYEPYPGPGNITHNSLGGLTVGDEHTQYLPINGVRVMQNNFGTGSNWVNSSGNSQGTSSDNRGLQFQFVSSIAENINIGSGTKFIFKSDNSQLANSKGVAKAWINFNGSGNISVRDSYNIQQIERVYSGGSPSAGKFKITFVSGILANNNYVVMANSNARGDNDSGEDFNVNTVGTVSRLGDDAASLRNLTFYILNDAGQYVDAAVNDLVIFGREAGTISGVQPTIVN
jgi:hypothetical protein